MVPRVVHALVFSGKRASLSELFLALEESSFVTGHGLVIDGGQTLRM